MYGAVTAKRGPAAPYQCGKLNQTSTAPRPAFAVLAPFEIPAGLSFTAHLRRALLELRPRGLLCARHSLRPGLRSLCCRTGRSGRDTLRFGPAEFSAFPRCRLRL